MLPGNTGRHRQFEYSFRELLKIDEQLLKAAHAEAKAERQRLSPDISPELRTVLILSCNSRRLGASGG